MTFHDHLNHVNAATHKRRFVKIIMGSNTEVAQYIQRLSNLIHECNGDQFYDTPMITTSPDTESKIYLRWNIPSSTIDRFELEYNRMKG